VLLDSGATTSAIDRQAVLSQAPADAASHSHCEHKCRWHSNSAGLITFSLHTAATHRSFTHRWTFRVTTLHDADLYLGFDCCDTSSANQLKDLTLSVMDQNHSEEPVHSQYCTGVPEEYAEFAEVFLLRKLRQFPPERVWDHEIKFIEWSPPSSR